MGEMSFSCPHCNTELACDEHQAGQTIQCPSCQNWLVAPSPPGAAPPPPQQRVSGGTSRPGSKRKKRRKSHPSSKGSGRAAKVIKISVVVLILGVAFYFGWGLFTSWQESFNEESRKAAKDADGGQLGHIADLYSVLETTDPSNYMGGYAAEGDMSEFGEQGLQANGEQQAAHTARMQSLPIVQPTWSLDVESITVPDGRACGRIAGTNFVAELARIAPAGASQVLSIRQGADVQPDQEILVYFRLSPEQEIGGQAWTISPDMKGRDVPQVAKRWRTNPNFAPKQKVYNSGYAMKLDLTLSEQGAVTGTIYVALPDEEQTVVGGTFYAETVLPQPSGYAPSGYAPSRNETSRYEQMEY